MSDVILILTILLWSSSKYIVGSGIALATLTPIEGFVVTAIGGVGGVVIWVLFGNALMVMFKKVKGRSSQSKVFSKKNRFLIKLKQKGGIWVIAILTPGVISIPVGCLLSTYIMSDHFKIIRIQSFSVLAWSFVIFGGKYILTMVYP